MRSFFDSRVVRSLASVRVGIVLGLAVSALLGVSSLLIPSPRSRQALPFSESFEPFVSSIEPRHWWFYALGVLIALLGLNVALSTLRSVVRRPRAQWDLRFAGIVLMHVGVIAGFVTHLAAGLSADIEQRALVTGSSGTVAGREMRIVDLEQQMNPDGTMRTASAVVTVDGERTTLGYNDPVFFDGLRRFVLIQELQRVAGGAAFTVAGERVEVGPAETFAGGRWRLVRTSAHPSLRAPMALVSPADGAGEGGWLAPGQTLPGEVVFERVRPQPALAVAVRRNDGVPVLVAASAVFTLGLVLFVAGQLRRRHRAPAG